jgi:hypothetical protein
VLDDVYLEVLTVELEEGSARKWRFGGIGGNFTAPIEDPAFMQKVARNEIVFGAGDQLRARVEITQRREPAPERSRRRAGSSRSTSGSRRRSNYASELAWVRSTLMTRKRADGWDPAPSCRAFSDS